MNRTILSRGAPAARLIATLALFVFSANACSGDSPQGGNTPARDAGDPASSDGGVDPSPRDAGTVTADGDGDRLDDAWEREHGLDPTRDDSQEDHDGDGISNINEQRLGTFPDDIDTDDDGLADGEEDANHNGVQDAGETDAVGRDSDGDGLSDGIESGRTTPLTSPRPGIRGTDPAVFQPDANAATTTSPSSSDSDGDGIPDGVEDRDRNGRVDASESDPIDRDSDDDGIADGTEDANHNGLVDPGETQAFDPDSDRDGIPDGVEKGVNVPIDDPDGTGPLQGTDLAVWRPDLEPASTTDPLDADTDGDGVADGDEDWNHDGRYAPPAELDPSLADSDSDGIPDASEGVAIVCSAGRLRAIALHALASADMTLALPLDYSEVSVLRESSGRGVGLMFRNPQSGVVGFAVSKTPSGATVSQEKQDNRNRIDNAANLSNEQDRALITWDGFDAVFTTANASQGGATAVELAADMARRVAQAGALTGALPNAGGTPGNFTVYFETILRGTGRAIVVGALSDAPTLDTELIALSDVANGTGVAQFGDFTGIGCDAFTTPNGNDVVDLLWVVDNSCSMTEEQNNVAAAGSEMVALLSTTQLSWRLALTTTEQAAGSINCCGVSGFTPSSPRTTAETASSQWAAAVGALGTGGSGEEKGATIGIAAARAALPATSAEDPLKFREGASVIIVHMSDEEDFTVKEAAGGNDQSCPENGGKQTRITELIDGYLQLTQEPSIAGITTFAIHGLQPNTTGSDFCDFGSGSGDCTGSAHYGRSYVDIASAMGGGAGSICGNMSQVVQDIIRAGAGIASQIELTESPISSTIRVVMADESGSFLGQPDVPRSRQNGFDYAFALDVMANVVKHKIVFYGTARPPANRALMISYRTWEDGSPSPGGPLCDCGAGQRCNADTNACEIDPTCGGGCPQGMICNPNTGLCGPDDPCMGMCGPSQMCIPDTGTCAPITDPCNGLCQPGQICDTSTDPPSCKSL